MFANATTGVPLPDSLDQRALLEHHPLFDGVQWVRFSLVVALLVSVLFFTLAIDAMLLRKVS